MKSPNQTESPGRVASALAEADRHRKSGHPADAERVLRRHLAENQPSADAMNYLALLLAQRGELPEAASLFEGAIRLAPKAAALHNNLLVLCSLPVWVLAPLAIAAIIHSGVPGARFFRLMVFLPAVLSPVVIGA